MNIPVIDTHVHLDEFPDPDRVIEEAREAQVAAIVAVGMDLASNKKILELARRYPGFVYPAIGYHPWKITPVGGAGQSAVYSRASGSGRGFG